MLSSANNVASVSVMQPKLINADIRAMLSLWYNFSRCVKCLSGR